MSMTSFSDWLYATQFSTALRETTWAIPNLQTIHIIAIAVVIGSAIATELRMAGIFATDRALPDVLHRYLPWMKWALAVLLLTGALLVIAEPGRTLTNTLFWIKMALVLTAFALTFLLRHRLLAIGEATPQLPDRALGWTAMAIWIAALFCGRWIAYTY